MQNHKLQGTVIWIWGSGRWKRWRWNREKAIINILSVALVISLAAFTYFSYSYLSGSW